MTQKTIILGLVAVAFVAGSIMTGGMAYAKENPNGQPFQALWDAIGALQIQVDDTSTTDDLQDQIDALVLVNSQPIDIVTANGPEVTASCGNNQFSTAICPAGYQPIGGNVAKIWSSTGAGYPGVVFSQPHGTTGWDAAVFDVPCGHTTIFRASAQCALVGP